MKMVFEYTTDKGTTTTQTFIGADYDSIEAQICEFEEYMHDEYGGYKSKVLIDGTESPSGILEYF